VWHLLIHAIVFAARCIDDDGKPVASKPYTSLDYLKSELKHLKETLANGTAMRKQTPIERDANPSTYGYSRYPLTEEQRQFIERKIEHFEQLLGAAKKRKGG